MDILGGLAALVAILAFTRTVLIDFHNDLITGVKGAVNERAMPIENDIKQIKLDVEAMKKDVRNAPSQARAALIMENFNKWMNDTAPGYKKKKP